MYTHGVLAQSFLGTPRANWARGAGGGGGGSARLGGGGGEASYSFSTFRHIHAIVLQSGVCVCVCVYVCVLNCMRWWVEAGGLEETNYMYVRRREKVHVCVGVCMRVEDARYMYV